MAKGSTESGEPDWTHYRSFLAVMREGSLSAAARVLGMTQPSLGRHIRELESRLDAALFSRSPHGLMPNDIAHELLPHAQAMATASAAFLRTASSTHGGLRGVVRVTASEVIGAEVLPAILAGFRREHPGVVVELSLSNQTADLLRREADIAIRMLRPSQDALVARQVGAVTLALHAHRRYLDAHGRPRTLADLREHALIGFDRETPFIRSLRAKLAPFARDDFALRTDNDLAALGAIRAGYGIGLCQVGLARRDPLLVRLLADQLRFDLPTWVVMHEDLRRSARVRMLFDCLATGLLGYMKTATLGPAR